MSILQRSCRYGTCNAVAVNGTGHCIEHWKLIQKMYNLKRGTSTYRGYGARWTKYRKLFLARNPLCLCGQPATDIDHLIPVNGADDVLFWRESNHQSLCHSCHSKKTIKERGYLRHMTVSHYTVTA